MVKAGLRDDVRIVLVGLGPVWIQFIFELMKIVYANK
jgi:hypothetical protein